MEILAAFPLRGSEGIYRRSIPCEETAHPALVVARQHTWEHGELVRQPGWTLTHRGTGYAIALVDEKDQALDIARRIAEVPDIDLAFRTPGSRKLTQERIGRMVEIRDEVLRDTKRGS